LKYGHWLDPANAANACHYPGDSLDIFTCNDPVWSIALRFSPGTASSVMDGLTKYARCPSCDLPKACRCKGRGIYGGSRRWISDRPCSPVISLVLPRAHYLVSYIHVNPPPPVDIFLAFHAVSSSLFLKIQTHQHTPSSEFSCYRPSRICTVWPVSTAPLSSSS
jgi:hypothetical protein